ncbi:MAG: hypothetical protein PQJ48_00260 [Sphaerochaetaceae bacterium]|nr:hypothetical protein [Sphaerochaetaceae bacterium]
MNRKALFVGILILVLLAGLVAPLGAKVSRSSSRILSIPDNIITTRKAKFKLGDILTNEMVSMTIENDPKPAYLLLVLELEIDSDSITGESTARAEIVKHFAGNETLTFTNTDILKYTSNVKRGSVSQSLKDVFGVSGMDSLTESFFTGGKQEVPEGIYKLSLLAYEIDNENATSGRSLIEKQSLTFKVVNIEPIEILQTPTVSEPILKFRVPQIPYYSEMSISNNSTTHVTITGPGMNTTIRKDHRKVTAPSMNALKGYPSDLQDGIVTYDLSTVLFRAGGEYSFDIIFKDDSNYEIDTKTAGVKFPTPKFNTTVDVSQPLLPLFRWSFNDDYALWASEYHVYLNEVRSGISSTNSYTPKNLLWPSTTYNWYVMPINRDGTPFFSSDAVTSQSFKTKDHTELTISIDNPPTNATLLTDLTYSFSANAVFSDGAELKHASWKVGADILQGTTTSYTPTKQYTNNSLLAYLSVTDTLNMSKNSENIYLTVHQPQLAIQGEPVRDAKKKATVIFTLDPKKSRHYQSISWYLDDKQIGTGSTVAYNCDTSGVFSVVAKGESTPDYLGNTKQLESAPQQITVIGTEPIVSLLNVEDSIQMLLGSTLDIYSAVQNDNQIKSIQWSYTGPESGNLGSTLTQATFSPSKTGEYIITQTVTDIYNEAGTASARILVIDPEVRITNIDAGKNFPLDSTHAISYSATNAKEIQFFVDGKELLSDRLIFGNLGLGNHTVFARAIYSVVDKTGNQVLHTKDTEPIQFLVRDIRPPEIQLRFPAYNTRLMRGVTYTLEADVSSTSPITESYWELNGTRLASNTFTVTKDMPSILTIRYTAKNQDNMEKTVSTSVRKIDPTVFINPPETSDIPSSGYIPIVASTTENASLFWIIDGEKLNYWNKNIPQVGEHTIQAGWSIGAADENGNYKVYEGVSEEVKVTIYSDEPPKITSYAPTEDVVRQTIHTPVQFSLTTSDGYEMDITKWNIYDQKGIPIRQIAGETLQLQNYGKGVYTVQAIISDKYGRTDSHEWTVSLFDPQVSIAFPKDGEEVSLKQIEQPIIQQQDIKSYALTLNGEAIPNTFNWVALESGEYSLSIEGLYNVSDKTELQRTPPHTISFSIAKDKTPPEFEVDIIKNNDRIIAGLDYRLTAHGKADETFTWILNGKEVGSGPEYTLRPSTTQKNLTLIARGKRNGITLDKTFNLRIINPFYAMNTPKGGYENFYPLGSKLYLSYSFRDIDRVEWIIDGSPSSSNSISLPIGMHTIELQGYASQVRLPEGTLKDYRPSMNSNETRRDIQIVETQRVLSIDAPDEVLEGQSFVVRANTSREDPRDLLNQLTLYIDDTYNRRNYGNPVNRMFTLSSLIEGNHMLKIYSSDVFDRGGVAYKPINVYKPLELAIISPTDAQRISPDVNVIARTEVLTGKINRLTWRIDNRVVPNSNYTTVNLGKLEPGKHTISVSAEDVLGNIKTEQISVEIQSDFQLDLLQPVKSMETVVGTSVSFLAGVDKVIGSAVNVTDAARHITWYVNNTSTNKNGISYLFDAENPGTYTIYSEYDHNEMVRTTSSRTITVRDIASPQITYPKNGQTILYADGSTILLSAKGEPGATYHWMHNNEIVAIGPEANFNPNGYEGEIQLKLVTSAFGRSKQQLLSFFLDRNTPPSLMLSVPEIQYTGDMLNWTAAASDSEDQTTNQAITFALDGLTLSGGNPRELSSKDVGAHTLVASTSDSLGATTTQLASFKVVETTLPLELLSPQEGATYYKGFEIPLLASLSQGEEGTYTWTVQYLDDPSIPKKTFQTKQAMFTSEATGSVLVGLVFTDTNGRERGRKQILLSIENEPIYLNINWPHGSIVNAGTPLIPTLQGLPDNWEEGELNWYLAGFPVEDATQMVAPSNSGTYTLSAVYHIEERSEQASVEFKVNTEPSVSITSIADGDAYKTGTPLILSANVIDDQTYTGTVTWSMDDGTLIGEGNPLIYTSTNPGIMHINAKATDDFQLSGRDAVSIEFYDAVQAVTVAVNDGLPTYLISEDAPALPMSVSFTGGRSPQVSWQIRQGNKILEKQGLVSSFAYEELKDFQREPAIVSMILSDRTMLGEERTEILRKDIPLQLTSDATLEILDPVASTIYRVGQDVDVMLSMTGFTEPAISITINEIVRSVTWELSDDARTAKTTIPANQFGREGVYLITVSTLEEGVFKESETSINLYEKPKGIYIVGAPEIFDKTVDTVQITADTSDLEGVDKIFWKSDLSTEPIGTGAMLDLGEADLQAGSRSITVEAYNGEQLLASNTITLQVLQQIEVSIEGGDELLVVRGGADVTLTAKGTDRDGTVLAPESFTWSSHLNGSIDVGNILSFANHPNLSGGEHIIAVQVVGKDGSIANALKMVQIIGLPEADEPQEQQTQVAAISNDQEPSGSQEEGGDSAAPSGQQEEEQAETEYFDLGRPIDTFLPSEIPDPFGPGAGGAPPSSMIEDEMNSFLGANAESGR